MRPGILFVAAVVGAILALPGVSGAQGLTQDSVLATGATTDIVGTGVSHRDIDLRAVSGPSGESPTGRVFFVLEFGFGSFNVGSQTSDNVTCVAVDGNSAVVGFVNDLFPAFGPVIVKAVDNGPADSGLDEFLAIRDPDRDPADCAWPYTQPLQPFTTGDVAIHDAPPLPTSKEQCRNGGWQTYGIFKNQGDCVSFVATGGKDPPAGP